MNVLNVLNYAPGFGGGIADHLLKLSYEARLKGINLMFGFPKKQSWQSQLQSESDVLIIPEIQKPLRMRFSNVLRKICEQNKIELVHFHFMFALPFSLALTFNNLGTSTIYHWHNPPLALNDHFTPGNKIKGKIKRQISSLVAKFTDRRIITRNISMSKEITDLLVKHKWTTEDKITFIPNGVVLSNGKSNNTEFKKSDRKIIGSVSNFRPQKDHVTLVKAFNILVKDNLDCELWLVGDGETKSEIENLVKELGVESRVRFVGTVLNTAEVYRQFDIFTLSSHYEGHPLVILEAMSHGLPIVATEISSIPETIKHNINGMLVKHQDPTDLAEALRKLILDKQLRIRLGFEARKTAERQPTVDDWANNVLKVYEECLSKSKKV